MPSLLSLSPWNILLLFPFLLYFCFGYVTTGVRAPIPRLLALAKKCGVPMAENTRLKTVDEQVKKHDQLLQAVLDKLQLLEALSSQMDSFRAETQSAIHQLQDTLHSETQPPPKQLMDLSSASSKGKAAVTETHFMASAREILPSPRIQPLDSGESSLKGSQSTAYSNTPAPKPQKIKLPRFEGDDPRGWLRECDRLFSNYNIAEGSKLETVAMYLDGKAHVWFQEWVREKSAATWSLFQSDLSRGFGDPSYPDAYEEIKRLKQTGSVRDYQEQFEELRSLVLKSHPSMEETFFISSFLSGLSDEIRSLLEDLKPKSLEEVFLMATIQEGAMEAVAPKKRRASKTATTTGLLGGIRVCGVKDSEKKAFHRSGPCHLTSVDWKNEHHQWAVVASLAKGVSTLERDRQLKRQGPQALAPPWWQFFHFRLFLPLVDGADSSIFGAIYKYEPPTFHCHHSLDSSPRYIIAFRGTILKPKSFFRDLKLDLRIIVGRLHRTSRFKIAIQAVSKMVDAVGEESNIWLAGHSLGAAVALVAGKTMAKNGKLIQTFLFNPPLPFAPTESIKAEWIKRFVWTARSFIVAGLAVAAKKNNQNSCSEDPFVALWPWVPHLFVNRVDDICSGYIGFFEQRKTMYDSGLGAIERLATLNSVLGLFMSYMGKEVEPLHLMPSAKLIVNITPAQNSKEAHKLRQWWRADVEFHCELYQYK